MNYEEILEKIESYIKDNTNLGTTLFRKNNELTESILVDLKKVSKYIDKHFCRNIIYVVLCKVNEPEESGEAVDAKTIYEKIKPNFDQYYIDISITTLFFNEQTLYFVFGPKNPDDDD